MPTFRIAVNNQVIDHHGQEGDRLLNVLHDEGLSASKMGCGSGHCGACTLWVDGKPARSCDVTIGSICATNTASGQLVITLEGLTECEPKLARCLVDAFVKEQAAQCGYCSAGILMKAAALILDHNAQVGQPSFEPLSEPKIAQALDDHLCRCGSHRRVLRAVQLANNQFTKT
jgi:nicotinate dehydrogenase subunit A